MLRVLLVLAVLAVSLGCDDAHPNPTPLQTNADPAVAKYHEMVQLFEADGCNVYRFWDKGYYHYFTRCHGTSSVTFGVHQEGKVRHHDEIPTVVEP